MISFFMESDSFEFFIRYSIHFLIILFLSQGFILSIFEEEEKNFRNKRLDNLEEGKWHRFFMESDCSFEFFFSLFHPFFSFRKIYFINFKKEFSKSW